jgi:hypothetical protein
MCNVTNEFIGQWCLDIGAHGKRGQLLAEIETPDLKGLRSRNGKTSFVKTLSCGRLEPKRRRKTSLVRLFAGIWLI